MSDKTEFKKTNKPKWVSKTKVMSMPGQYRIVLGPWSNGKSYAAKNGIIEDCYRTGKKLAYVRRNDLENRDNIIENYFLDVDVEGITKGKYTGIICYRKDIYFANYDSTKDKWIKGQILGRGFSVYAYAHTKSGVYSGYKYMLFEEFITTEQYLMNEPYKLSRLVSSIARNDDIIVYLIGNTITPLCPYYNEWELINVSKQKQGTIDKYIRHNEDGTETHISVYMTEPTDKKSNMFFKHNKEIHGGAFHSDEHDKVEGDIKEADIIYTIVFCYQNKKMLGQFVDLHGAHFWYISPKTSDIQNNTRTIGDLRLQSDFHTKGLTPLTDGERTLFNYLLSGRIRYSDNLTGTIFLQMLDKIKSTANKFI